MKTKSFMILAAALTFISGCGKKTVATKEDVEAASKGRVCTGGILVLESTHHVSSRIWHSSDDVVEISPAVNEVVANDYMVFTNIVEHMDPGYAAHLTYDVSPEPLKTLVESKDKGGTLATHYIVAKRICESQGHNPSLANYQEREEKYTYRIFKRSQNYSHTNKGEGEGTRPFFTSIWNCMKSCN